MKFYNYPKLGSGYETILLHVARKLIDSMSSFPCTDCSFVGTTRAAVRHHQSVLHTNESILTKNGNTVTVERTNGIFTCDRCGRSSTSSLKFKTHSACYFSSSSSSTFPATNTDPVTEGKTQNLQLLRPFQM